MIVDLEVKDPYIDVYFSSKNKPDWDELLQLNVYRQDQKVYDLLFQKLLRVRKYQKFLNLKNKLKSDYYIFHVSEANNYYWDAYDPNLYLIRWRKLKWDEVHLPSGSQIFHLAKKENVESILKNGLSPSSYSHDFSFYGSERIYFSTTIPVESKIDPYLKGRTLLEVNYDGSYALYRDPEYNHIKNHSMVYTLTKQNIVGIRVV